MALRLEALGLIHLGVLAVCGERVLEYQSYPLANNVRRDLGTRTAAEPG